MEREVKSSENIKFVEGHQEGLILGAVDLVNSFSKQGLLLPVSADDYKKLAEEKRLVVALDGMGKVIATAAYSQIYENNIYEFGGWSVDTNHQQKGLGYLVIKKLLLGNIHWKTIAFGNKNSGPIFEKLGARKVINYSVIPNKAFELCNTCPAKPKNGCCDTIYDLSTVVFRLVSKNFSPRQTERLIYGIGENQLSGMKDFDEDWGALK